jgi:hypothetical protein
MDESRDTAAAQLLLIPQEEEEQKATVFFAEDGSGWIESPEGLYDYFSEVFAELVDTVDGDGNSGDGGNIGRNGRKVGERRKVTLKTFRDFVKSTISDLGYSDFSEVK